MNAWLRAALPFAVALGLTATFSAAARADDIRAAPRDGYARLVFDWDTPVRFSADVVAGQLMIQFDRPIAGNVVAADQALGAYASGPGRLSADGRTLTYALRPNVTMRSFPVGNAVVIDFVSAPQPSAATPPAAPQQTAAKPAASQTQTAAAPGASRPPAQSGAKSLAAAPQAAEAKPPETAALSLAGLSKPVTVRTADHDKFFRLALDWPGKTTYLLDRKPDKLVITFDRPALIDPAALNRGLPATLRPATVTTENGHTIVSIPLAGDGQVHDFINDNTIVFDLTPGSKTPAASQTANANANAGKETKAAAEAPAVASKPAPGKSQKAEAKAEQPDSPPGQVSLTIPFDEPSAAAVFRRAGFTWMIFDRYRQLDIDKLQKDGAPYISYIEQLPFRNNTIVRMILPPEINAAVRRDGMSWIFDLRAMPERPTRAIDVKPQMNRDEAGLFLGVSEAGRTVEVEDPEVGDIMLVVPVIPLSEGIYPERHFPDLDLPATSQGVVVLPKSDGVRAQATNDGIDIETEGGMVLSKAFVDQTEPVVSEAEANRNFDIADWQVGRPDDYVRNKQLLQAALSDERPEAKQDARFRLARFEFANGFYPEAYGIEKVMRDSDADVENTAPFRALRGATELMMRRFSDASEDLNHISLASDNEARFWLAAARAKLGHPEAQAQTLIQTGSVVRDYPPKVKITLSLIALDAAIASGDEFGARGFLDILRKESADADQQAMIDYLDGRLNLKFGDPQVALQQFTKAEAGSNLFYSVLAGRDRMELQHKLGTLSTADMIDGFEKLRYRWRGDDVELGLLLRLADLYSEQQDYGTALRTLKLATQYFSNDDERVEQAAVKMSDIFKTLYLDGDADKLQPVVAIGLFDEFRSLVPPGPDGDEMVRKLADRLVSVDLLDEAAVLLERQVEFRVTGVDRARIGARLALVYLMNRTPQKAVDVLRDTQSVDAGHELNAQRRRLEARALTDLGKVDDAILMLGADTSPESLQLRAEIYWRSQDWADAAKAIADLVPDADAGPLDENAGQLVLNWVTALTLAGDDRTITRVRQKYAGAMAKTPFADAFALITTPKDRGGIDVNAVRAQVEQAEHFKSFMAEYKDMLGQKPLSAIN